MIEQRALSPVQLAITNYERRIILDLSADDRATSAKRRLDKEAP